MPFRTNLSKSIDAVALGIFKRANYHRAIGEVYLEYAYNTLPKVLESVSKDHSKYLEENLKQYQNRAYLEVQGQTLLIDMDIFGVDVEKQQPKANQAALATGLLWYAIKLVDNYIDKHSLTKNELEDFLYLTKESWKSGNITKSTDPRKERLINSTSSLLYSGYVGEPLDYMGSLQELCYSESRYLFSHQKEKINAAKEVGTKSAQLTINLVQQYIPEYPNNFERFLIEQGITGKLFDDFKDVKIDRDLGRGYDNRKVLNLALQGIRHFYRHFKVLPTFQSKWRNLNFIILASLFHIEELLGRKEKS